MSDKVRIKIAAAVTPTFLAAMSLAGAIVRANKPTSVALTISQGAVAAQPHSSGQSHFSKAWHEQDQHE